MKLGELLWWSAQDREDSSRLAATMRQGAENIRRCKIEAEKHARQMQEKDKDDWLDFFFNRLGMQLARKEFVDVDQYMTEVQFEGFDFHKGFSLLVTTRFYKAHLPSYERIRLLLVEMIEEEPVDERSKRIARMALEGMR